jgi:D-glycero-D-manno-heptose 1,7-bisphosphate phosphatase
MILEAMADFAIQKEASWMVGDKEVDVLCGQRAGVKSMLVRTGYGNQYQGASPDGIADDAVHAVQFILGANLPSVS